MSLQQSMSVNTSLKNAMIFVYGAEEDSKLESNLKSSTTTTNTTLDSSNQKEERKQPTGNGGGGGGVSSGKIVQRASNRFSRTSSVPYQRNASGNAKRNNSGQEMHGRSTSSRSPNDADADVSSSNQRTDPAESQDTKQLQEAECSSSSSEGSSSRKSSCSRYSGKPENRQKREKDPDILNRRQKQIDYGKNTIGYDNYIRTVPRHERKFDDPRTPDKCRVYSRRAFDGLIKEWRLKLHKYDDA